MFIDSRLMYVFMHICPSVSVSVCLGLSLSASVRLRLPPSVSLSSQISLSLSLSLPVSVYFWHHRLSLNTWHNGAIGLLPSCSDPSRPCRIFRSWRGNGGSYLPKVADEEAQPEPYSCEGSSQNSLASLGPQDQASSNFRLRFEPDCDGVKPVGVVALACSRYHGDRGCVSLGARVG